MYSQWGIIDAKVFKATGATDGTEDRKANQLVKLDADGTLIPAAAAAGGNFYPVKQLVNNLTDDHNVDYQLTGVASIFVEVATGIVAGSPVYVGPLGRGVSATGTIQVGIAMLAAAGLNEIPVLLQAAIVAE